jgi:hypothetical protein
MVSDPRGDWIVGVAGAGIGAIVGAGTSLVAQLIQNEGDWSCVNWSNVGWSAATGGVQGFLLTTPLGLSFTGIAGVGAGGGFLSYGLTTPRVQWTDVGAGAAVVSGAIGGVIVSFTSACQNSINGCH